ncbi:MAG: hypothetical protein ACXWQO_04480 [Bdellovibrionota bacterium]
MKFLAVSILYLVLAHQAFAENPVPAQAPAASAQITYELKNLKPMGFTYQAVSAPLAFREFMKFQNEDGVHQFLYEEALGYLSLKEMNGPQQAVSSPGLACDAEVECSNKAFCINDCHEMYYEFSNLTSVPPAPDENRCHVVSFSCTHAIPSITPASIPLAAKTGP